jgi:proteasome assembly chaperone (PAC2) family protein
MNEKPDELLRIRRTPNYGEGTLVLAFTGWMDGGDVSTGTVERLARLVDAEPVAEIDPDPFYIFNFPGSMEIAALFRPATEIHSGVVRQIEMPTNIFYAHDPGSLLLFVGSEPNLRWRTFGECLFRFAHQTGVRRILFVGSFGGTVPHTREPRLYVTCSDAELLPAMEQYQLRRTDYEGPGSFTTYLMAQAESQGLEMISLVAEIPAYLQGANPTCIEAVTRRLSKILRLPLDLDSLRSASTEWELQVSSAIEENAELAARVRELEEQYDNDLLRQEADGS